MTPAQEREMEAWASHYGLRPSGRHGCARGLLSKRCMTGHSSDGWLDHARLFTYEGTPAVLISQPYGVTHEGMTRLWELAALEGFEVGIGICGQGWYGHGTVLVEVWRSAEVYRQVVICRDGDCEGAAA